jgi:hypothetical protein
MEREFMEHKFMQRKFMQRKFMQRKPESMRLFPVLLLLLTFACSDFAGCP